MVGFIVDLSWFFRHFLHPPVGATSAVLAFVLSWAKKSASGADMHGAQWSEPREPRLIWCSCSVQILFNILYYTLYILCFYTLHVQIRFHIDRTFAAPHLSLTASRSRGRGLVFLPSAPAEDAPESPTSSGDLHRNSPKQMVSDRASWLNIALDALDASGNLSNCYEQL